LAPTGKIGRKKEDGLPSGVEEATAKFKRAYYNNTTIEAAPAEWQYQFDRFGLITAKAAPTTPDNPDQDVWQWDREAKSGYATKYRAPAGRGYTDGLTAGNDADYPAIPNSLFDETLYAYSGDGDLQSITYA